MGEVLVSSSPNEYGRLSNEASVPPEEYAKTGETSV
jgi:hypothetical protein